ncbi:MAG: cob(I)yrinic acid a,c-diamide adenosyltransferase [Deltaproteobacteria bacterium]|nr:cob(I)yrinic acid a,c-diamide adenosyltransferase [Deltaproteobacteria bacterium]
MGNKGLIHIYTGEGKGKTTAALGLSVRAAGQGLSVLFVQFFKEDGAIQGKRALLKTALPNIEIIRSNSRHPIFCNGETMDSEKLKDSIRRTFETVIKKVREDTIDILVLDEIMSAINGGWIGIDELIRFLDERPLHLEVVLTGRSAPVELVRIADYVTEMLKIKHPFDYGIKARKGIEF